MADETIDKVGLKLAGFEILEKIAEGGMGAVYKARQLSLGRVVAVKVLPARLAQDETFVRQFQIESRAAANLKHPHLIEVYDAGKFDETHFFVMEYVEGETVGDRLRREGSFVERAAIAICMNVAQALQYAWEKAQLIHGDIKPDNLILERESKNVRIADLGLGKCQLEHSDDSHQLEASGYPMGTPVYLSPEQARGEKKIDFRSDMYALGATLHHMLTGKIPFDGLQPVEVMAQHLQGRLPDPRTVRPGISESTITVLERMLAKDPALRYPSWAALAHDLSQIHQGRTPSVPALPAGRSTLSRVQSQATLPPPPKKSRLWIPVSIAILVVAVLATTYLLHQHPALTEKPSPPPSAVEPVPTPPHIPPTFTPPEPKATPEPPVAEKPVEDDTAMKAKALADATERYETWHAAFEAMLTAGDYSKARESVTAALAEQSFALVKDKLVRDERVAQLILRLREVAIQNLPGQTYFLGSTPGKVSRVEGDKFWVKLPSGEVAVPIEKLDAAKTPSLALRKNRSDPELNLAAALYCWYRGEKDLSRAYFEAARNAGADVQPFLPAAFTPSTPGSPSSETAETPKTTTTEQVIRPGDDGQNMLANPGFERWSGKMLLDWSPGSSSARPVKDTSVTVDGQCSARFDCSTPQSITLEQPFHVLAGRSYRLEFSYRASTTDGKLWVEMGPPGDPMPLMKQALEDSAEWLTITLDFSAPSASTLLVRLRGSGVTGVIWLDHVDLRMTGR